MRRLSSQARSPGKRKLEPKTPLLCVRVGTTRYTRSGAWGKSPSGWRLPLCESPKHLDLFCTLNLGRLEIHFLLIEISPRLRIQAIVLGHLIAFLLETLSQPRGNSQGKAKNKGQCHVASWWLLQIPEPQEKSVPVKGVVKFFQSGANIIWFFWSWKNIH